MNTSTFRAIERLGFPVVLSCILIFNSYSSQAFLQAELSNRNSDIKKLEEKISEQTAVLREIKEAIKK